MIRRSTRSARAAQWQHSDLPLKGYFLWVGSTLFAVMLAANSLLPAPEPNRLIGSRVTLPTIRIYSATKAPDEVAAAAVSSVTVSWPTKSETAADAPSSPDIHSGETVLLQSPHTASPAETHERRRAASVRPALNTREAFAQFMPREPGPTRAIQDKALPNRKKEKL